MSRSSPFQPALRRRAVLAGSLALAGHARAAGRPTVRLGLVQFGTVQWIADVIRRHKLDVAQGFTLAPVPLASTDSGRIAIMGGQADIVILDWLFVAIQRGNGNRLCFAPLSSSSGGIMARPDSAIRDLTDLRGKRLGVAGGPVDKSWLVVQAAARKQAGLDLTDAAQINYGAPPLLDAKLQQGELDAVLTFWNFAAKLEAEDFVQVIPVSKCAEALGLSPRLDLVGFVFHEDWAAGAGSGIDGFVAAILQARQILAGSPEEWQAIRPLMGAPDDRLFARLRERFSSGIATVSDTATGERHAADLFTVLKQTGGARATGGLASLPEGVFWHTRHGAG